ncbi:EamA family transporter [Moraxella boevrei]|uniref:EamA family transporter n=1 Tax=Faucicola boevrei TaxID=346665 RepID=UPI0037363291
MLYLFLAVFCSVSVSLLLKILRQHQIDIRQTILLGYPVACFLTLFLLKPDFNQLNNFLQNQPVNLIIMLALGILLPSVFVVLGKAIETSGVILTDACQRLSLILPIIASVVIFGETISGQKSLGITLAFLALFALLFKKSDNLAKNFHNKNNYLWLIGVWLGYGVIDILFKQVAKQGGSFPVTLSVSFGLAFVGLLIYLLAKKTMWKSQSLVWGLLLGILNMGNIYAYIKAHQALSESPSLVFTGMNVGVIVVASIAGFVFFGERLSKINTLGIGLAMLSVFMLFL